MKPAAEQADARNIGHGWVVPRPDGRKARCGGPGLCKECSVAQNGKTATVGTVTVKVVPEFDVVTFLRTHAQQVLDEADRIEADRRAEPYCGAIQTNSAPGLRPYACTRSFGHTEGRHGHAGVFWDD